MQGMCSVYFSLDHLVVCCVYDGYNITFFTFNCVSGKIELNCNYLILKNLLLLMRNSADLFCYKTDSTKVIET